MSPDAEDGSGQLKHENEASKLPVPFITWRMAVIGLVVSLGGIVFGYDTGQISGFLVMQSFKFHFGELDPSTGLYDFSASRAGLLFGIVRQTNALF